MRAALVFAVATTFACVTPNVPSGRATSPGELHVAIPTRGAASPETEVRLTARHAALKIRPGGSEHLVAGTIHATDPALLPHVTDGPRGIAIVQDFSPHEGERQTIAWDLALGKAPIRLDAQLFASEEETFDLGGLALTDARLEGEGGHLRIGWSAPNLASPELLELSSIGFLEVHQLGASRAARVVVRSVGLTEIGAR